MMMMWRSTCIENECLSFIQCVIVTALLAVAPSSRSLALRVRIMSQHLGVVAQAEETPHPYKRIEIQKDTRQRGLRVTTATTYSCNSTAAKTGRGKTWE
jgi:hypothetical protein